VADNRVLGVVGSRYELIQNEQAFEFLDAIVDGQSTRYESAGALGGGERVWILARNPDWDATGKGDVQQQYVMFSNSHDGSGALKVLQTNVRVICKNTHNLALATGSKVLSLRHTKGIKAKIRAAQEALAQSERVTREYREKVSQLVAKDISVNGLKSYASMCIDEIVDATIAGQQVTGQTIFDGRIDGAIAKLPVAESITERNKFTEVLSDRKALLNDILARFERESAMPESGGPTWWTASQAVGGAIEHGPYQPSYRGDERTRLEKRMDDTIQGVKAGKIATTFQTAYDMATMATSARA
jgi:hypothetical protein